MSSGCSRPARTGRRWSPSGAVTAASTTPRCGCSPSTPSDLPPGGLRDLLGVRMAFRQSSRAAAVAALRVLRAGRRPARRPSEPGRSGARRVLARDVRAVGPRRASRHRPGPPVTASGARGTPPTPRRRATAADGHGCRPTARRCGGCCSSALGRGVAVAGDAGVVGRTGRRHLHRRRPPPPAPSPVPTLPPAAGADEKPPGGDSLIPDAGADEYPTGNYDIGYDEGAWNSFGRKALGFFTGLGWTINRIMVGVTLWLVGLGVRVRHRRAAAGPDPDDRRGAQHPARRSAAAQPLRLVRRAGLRRVPVLPWPGHGRPRRVRAVVRGAGDRRRHHRQPGRLSAGRHDHASTDLGRGDVAEPRRAARRTARLDDATRRPATGLIARRPHRGAARDHQLGRPIGRCLP